MRILPTAYITAIDFFIVIYWIVFFFFQWRLVHGIGFSDAALGYGGKFGVEADKVDESAIGWEEKDKESLEQENE